MGSPSRNPSIVATGLSQLISAFARPRGVITQLAPVVQGITPATGPQAGGTLVRIFGQNLGSVTSVTIGGAQCTIIAVGGNIITCKTPSGTGTQNVVATAGALSSTLPNAFTYPAAVTVTSISPALGNDRGGTSVTISGSGFTGLSSATVGGVSISSFLVVNDTTITGKTGAHAKGNADVVVNGVTLSSAYQYLDATSLSGTTLWWRADKGATVVGGFLNALAEQISGVNNLALFGTAPTYFATNASFNNRSARGTNGSDAVAMLTNDAFASGFTGPLTVYHVWRVPSQSSGNNVYLRLGPGGGSSNSVSLIGIAGSTFTSNQGGAGLSFTPSVDTTYVECTVYNGASSAIYLSHYSTAAATGNIDTAPMNGLDTGSYPAEACQYLDAEIIVCAGAHNSAQRQLAMQSYLGDAYGVAVAA